MARKQRGSNQYRSRYTADNFESNVCLMLTAGQELPPSLVHSSSGEWKATVYKDEQKCVLVWQSYTGKKKPPDPVIAPDPDALIEAIQEREYNSTDAEPDHALWLSAMKAATTVEGVSSQALEQLGKSLYTVWNQAVASSPYTSSQLLVDLCGHPDPDTAAAALENSHCPDKMLAIALQSNHSSLQAGAARNPHCPHNAIIQALDSRRTFSSTLCVISQRSDTTPEILERLSKNPSCMVRQGVARNPNCPSEILVHLLQDEDHGVRLAVLNNPSLPKDYGALGALLM